MKFMMLLQSDESSPEAAAGSSDEALNAMGAYNEELIKAGVMLAGEGLHPSSTGVRVHYDGDERTVVDGPFTESKELLAGFWIIQVRDRDEAIEWARRIPLRTAQVEVRQIFDISEFDQDNEYVKKEKEWREATGESRTA
ncbi:YciI family protein [Diaminobutyricimonas sp. TR449]|uniref:YciI family protein n=1 Tax=Diaminobutyricimonas sp. TR449 TaxID=2708076 RepID=UPI00141D9088|nr:YciI family protein [Diaminobutyricimonas sp. TR449]